MSNIVEKIRERDRLVCELYESGANLKDIAEKGRISIGTIYTILKRYDISLRRDSRKTEVEKAVETVCRYFDLGVSLDGISDILQAEIKTIVLILKKYRGTQLEKYFKRIKIQEEYAKRKGIVEPEKAPENSVVKNVIARREQEKLAKEQPYLAGKYNEYLIRAMEGKTALTDSEKSDRDIARLYAQGESLADILSKFDISPKYLYELLESDNKYPGYFPDRPPLNV